MLAEPVIEAKNGSGAGSGQFKDWLVNEFGTGISSLEALSLLLWCRLDRGRKAEVKKSFTDFD